MRHNFLAHAIAATTMIAMPVAASAQAVANPAASLSVVKSVRASTPAQKKSALAGGGLIAAVIAAGVVAIGVIAIVNDSESDSN